MTNNFRKRNLLARLAAKVCGFLVIILFSVGVSSSVVGQHWGYPPQPDDANLSERFLDSLDEIRLAIEQQYDPPLDLRPLTAYAADAVENLNGFYREWRLVRDMNRNTRAMPNHPRLASPDRGVYGGKFFPPTVDKNDL